MAVGKKIKCFAVHISENIEGHREYDWNDAFPVMMTTDPEGYNMQPRSYL